MSSTNGNTPELRDGSSNSYIFWTCFMALIATSFGFMVRVLVMDQWQVEFNLSETEKGMLFGVGLWPFAISIVLFSLIIDKIGYKISLWFAFICHVLQVLLLITANDYWDLWTGTFIGALGNGTVEAVINPVIASIYRKAKSMWLTLLHAGWPGGLVLAGVLALLLKETAADPTAAGEAAALDWTWQISLILIPVVIYGIMLLFCRFPINERVAAGIPYKVMLQEAGVIGCFIVTTLIVMELGNVFEISNHWQSIVINMSCLLYGIYTLAFGKPLFILLLLLMIPLATTELGTDAWIRELLKPVTQDVMEIDAGWILVYTALIMFVLRLVISPLLMIVSPLVILLISSCLAAIGIFSLANVEGAILIVVAATIYGIGQSFFWPCTLGVVAEQFPRGGALTLNSIAGVGMLGVGIIGAPLLGNLQDNMVNDVVASDPEIPDRIMLPEVKDSVFGEYQQLDQEALAAIKLDEPVLHERIVQLQNDGKMAALSMAAIPPVFMAICYLLLIMYFSSNGGYKPVEILPESDEP